MYICHGPETPGYVSEEQWYDNKRLMDFFFALGVD